MSDWFTSLTQGLADGFKGLIGGIGDLFSGLFDFLGKMLQSIFDFFKPLIDFISWIIEFLGSLVSAIGKFIWSLFEGAINLIVGGISTLVDWVGSFFKFLGDLLHDLFVPSEDFFDKEVGKLNTNLNSKINVSELENSLNVIKGAQSRAIIQPRAVSFFGVNLEIDFMQGIEEHLSTIHFFIRAIVFVLLLRYNINNVYKLIRGSDLAGGDD